MVLGHNGYCFIYFVLYAKYLLSNDRNKATIDWLKAA